MRFVSRNIPCAAETYMDEPPGTQRCPERHVGASQTIPRGHLAPTLPSTKSEAFRVIDIWLVIMAVYEVYRNGRLLKGWSVRLRGPGYQTVHLGRFWTKFGAKSFARKMRRRPLTEVSERRSNAAVEVSCLSST